MAETTAPIRWLTETATSAFTIQRGRCEQGTFCLSHTARTDRVEIGYQLDLPAGMDVTAVMAAAEAADPATEAYWRWASTVPFQPSGSDFVRGLSQTHALIEAARGRTGQVPAEQALREAGFTPLMGVGETDALWEKSVEGGTYSLALDEGSVALAFDPSGSHTREPLLRLTLHRQGHPHRVYRFWPSFLQNRDALIAVALDAVTAEETRRRTAA